MQNETPVYQQVDKFDRIMGGLEGLPDVTKAKPSTVTTASATGSLPSFAVSMGDGSRKSVKKLALEAELKESFELWGQSILHKLNEIELILLAPKERPAFRAKIERQRQARLDAAQAKGRKGKR